MKRFGYFLAAVMALCFASCDEVPMPSGDQGYLTVATTSLQLDHTKGYFFVEVDSNVDWKISCSAEWVTLGDTEFSGVANVIVNYSANEQDKSRSAIVKVEPKVEGAANPAEVLITQRGKNSGGSYDDNGDIGGEGSGNEGGSGEGSGNEGGSGEGSGNEGGNNGGDDSEFAGSGDGTASSPYDVIRALDIINQLAYDETAVYTRGVISEIEQVDLSKGNAKYYISNNGATYNSQLYVYRGNYLDNEKFTSSNQISVGDEVVIYGPLLLYQSTKPEINTPNHIVSIVKANGGNDDGGNDDGGNDDGGNTGGGNSGDNGGANSGKHSRWAELPAIVDANGDGIHDNNSTLYYASHLCAGGEKNAQRNGKARNFTVCFSAEHHVPMWVAAPRHDCYESGAKRTDAYAKDPKIPADIQYDSKSTGGGCNKGHMLGSAERLSSTATNKQAFYYTNIAPQLSDTFNTGGGGWNTLEDWVDGQSCADTLYQVIGCYFDRYTDGYGRSASPKKISFGGRSDVSFPTMFYCVLLRTKKGSSGKSVFDCSASELKCVAFVRSHSTPKGQKVTRSEMMSVAELEKLTGFTFFVNVPNAPKSTLNPSDWGL
ncbi:MAG: DNA/RNA non-specific endonuclease [Tidjanibacter sp.]|nr:DNA/RNA non-specific endonuclease [Tidjanibacter sp.]